MKYDDLDILGFWLFAICALVCGTIIVIREVRKGPGRRNRRVTLPPPSSACERKYDAGWWS